MKRPIRRTPVRHVVLHALYSGDIYFDHETQTYHGPGHTELTPLADKALTLFLEHGMVGVTPSGKCTTTPGGTDMYDAWPRCTPEGVEFFIDTRESQAVSTSELPEARLMCSGLDGTPLYLVFKTKRGWVGAPGLRKGQVLTDEDVKDGIPYLPAQNKEND